VNDIDPYAWQLCLGDTPVDKLNRYYLSLRQARNQRRRSHARLVADNSLEDDYSRQVGEYLAWCRSSGAVDTI
jgi:hypothetical protein